MRKHPLSKETKRLIGKWRDRLGLPDWPVFFRFEPQEVMERDGNQYVGGMKVYNSDNEVSITISKDINPECLDWVVCHEMVHWLLDAIQCFVEAHVPDKGSQEHFDVLLDQTVEAITLALVQPERLAPARTYLLLKKEEGDVS